MKHVILLLISITLSFSAIQAKTYNFLNFVNTGNQITQFDTDGLTMTFNGSTATVTVGGQTKTVNLSTMAYLEFSDTKTESTTYKAGDVNGDGNVDVADINALINIITGQNDGSQYEGRQYVSDDNNVDIADINAVINIMTNSN